MNTKGLAKNYSSLTPEERFRLILAACGRGDDAELGRLENASERVICEVQDYTPHADAFRELNMAVYVDLLEKAAYYSEADARATDAWVDRDEDDEAEGDLDEHGDKPFWQWSRDHARGAGFMLKTKADGWKLFCETFSVPPFLVWEGQPGFDRLQRCLDLADQAPFTHAEFLRWMNSFRPKESPELTEMPWWQVERMADAIAKEFKELTERMGG